jgi:subtilisin family serine protease
LGIATVIASGNDYWSNAIEVPACVSGAISVGSTQDGSGGTTVDAVSNFSDSASFLTLLAPGQYIYSAVPGGGFQTMYGTSMATPHATGAWAVLKSARPSATVDQILNALNATGQSVTDSRNGITKPRIRVDGAADFLTEPKIYYFPIVSK